VSPTSDPDEAQLGELLRELQAATRSGSAVWALFGDEEADGLIFNLTGVAVILVRAVDIYTAYLFKRPEMKRVARYSEKGEGNLAQLYALARVQATGLGDIIKTALDELRSRGKPP
jgi:hypothetical protein